MARSPLATVTIQANSSNYTAGRSAKISQITIHHMAGVLSVEQCGNVFARAGRGASAHYGIGGDGRIASYVDEKDTAWSDANWASNCRTVSIETANSSTGGNWPVSDAAFDSLCKLVADVAKRNGLGTLVKGQNLCWHSMFAATTCPGDYLRGKMDELARRANELMGSGTPAPAPSTGKSLDEIANEVIAGKWGNGDDRRNRLQSAGYNYNEVQALVNQKLGIGGSAPATKSLDTIANEVIAGQWGNGDDRRNRLQSAGYDYNAVQALVNQKLGMGSAPAGKSNEQIANEVIRGEWGNGDDRRKRLQAAGYDYNAIQAIVNRKLG